MRSEDGMEGQYEHPAGLAGERGATGETGAAGATGEAGPAGPAGTGATALIEHATIEVNQADVTPASRQQARLLAYSLVVLFIFTIGIGLANLLFTNSQVHNVQKISEQAQANAQDITRQNIKLQRQILADCGFYRDLAGLPLTTAPGAKHPSELGVKVISDSRAAWVGHGCPGHLPSPDATFIAGAAFYHIPVVRDGT